MVQEKLLFMLAICEIKYNQTKQITTKQFNPMNLYKSQECYIVEVLNYQFAKFLCPKYHFNCSFKFSFKITGNYFKFHLSSKLNYNIIEYSAFFILPFWP